ncbi:CoxG family protein [Cupriavidus neocaledonicus]|uniref:Carbon monoxide dehydrogenase subunit G n=1 Tax=Cupriavidus neocaledonicus TaxID=1040979 RepID=A0A375HQS3_9BURK|nr:SRPBCC domain-containing protein [Cupriavidus neocaledonicus]SOZ40170.1 putative CARBON MONOXIDE DEHYDROGENASE SUBUNIT G, COG3427 [Cupriavidus neocaledonicus]SPD60489.1 Carbon monoxide dehydrogenase subunit G [Cupriavidus neocaledonicus]
MEIEKTLVTAAPPARVWELLLDPNVMGACVPGMASIEVLSEVEYIAHMAVKIAFINARFRLHTKIVETRAPHYLRTEGTGEDASVASSLRQSSELFLTPLDHGGTQLRIKVQVDVLGRLGTFGLSVMKTKADRMWDEFGANLLARLSPQDGQAAPEQRPAAAVPQPAAAPPPASNGHAVLPARSVPPPAPAGLLARLFGRGDAARGPLADICIELRRADETIVVRWPAAHGEQCAAWLRDYLRPGT